MQRDGIDYLALSGHKLYAPYGAGALIGERDWLSAGDPFLRGGGAVKLVTIDETLWAELPDRQEAGSPNVIGAVALGVACDTLAAAGMDRHRGRGGRRCSTTRASSLAAIDGFEHYRVWPAEHARVGLLTFNLRGRPVRPAGRGALGRARHRHPPRLLLRPPADDAAAARRATRRRIGCSTRPAPDTTSDCRARRA